MAERARVGYLVLSYTLPGQVLRLLRTLRAGSPDAHVLVHHDDRRCRLDRPALRAARAHSLEPPLAVEWGDFSQLAAVLRGFRWLLEHTDFEWLVLLSGQDYPVRPLAAIERDLATADCDAFIETRPVAPPSLRRRAVDEFASRYFYRYAALPDGPLAARLVALAPKARPLLAARRLPSGPRIGLRWPRPPFSGALRCHRGSDWFTLSRRCVAAVDGFAREHAAALRHYRRTLIPTESFVHTVLASEPALRLRGDNRRHTVWDPPPAARPRVLRRGDLAAALAGGADFARKFDATVDAAVLDDIDRLLGG